MIPDTATVADKALLDVVPLGRFGSMVPSIVAANIQAILGLPTEILPTRPRPDYALMTSRNQFDATKIVAALASETEGAPFKLGLTGHDLGAPILSYVYGESQLGGKAAVVSLHRLNDMDRQLTYERAAKISVHEVGHILGLKHCWTAGCLMRFSRKLEQLDELTLHFCSACSYEIGRRLAGVRP